MHDALHSLERRVAYTMSDVGRALERASSWGDMTTAGCPYATPYVEALYGRGTYRSLSEVKKTIASASASAKRSLGRVSAGVLTGDGHAQPHIPSKIRALDENLRFISDLIRLLMIMRWGRDRRSELERLAFSTLKNTPKSLLFLSFAKQSQVKTT